MAGLDRFLSANDLGAVTYRADVAEPARCIRLLCIAAGLLVAGCSTSTGSHARADHLNAEQEALSLHSGVLRPPNREPRLVLEDTQGVSYDVKAHGAGKTTLVYFGYTHCPDVCPTTMADIAQALRSVTPAVRAKVSVAFVSVDPHRDSRSVIRAWLDNFNPAFIGLRGPLRTIIAAQRAAHLPVSKVSPGGKEVEHAAQVLVYTPDRLEHSYFAEGPSTIEDLEHDLPILATGSGFGA
jgi:protein SCO1/2